MKRKITMIIVTLFYLPIALYIQLTASGTDYWSKMLLVVLAWVLSQSKMVNLNAVWSWMRVEKKLDLNKVWIVFFLSALLLKFGGGVVYRQMCADKIIAREKHLLTSAQYLGVPENTVKVREDMIKRQFDRIYFITYKCVSKKRHEYYLNKLKEQGYDIEFAEPDKIKAKKFGVIVTIRFDKEIIEQGFWFDDFFERWHL